MSLFHNSVAAQELVWPVEDIFEVKIVNDSGLRAFELRLIVVKGIILYSNSGMMSQKSSSGLYYYVA